MLIHKDKCDKILKSSINKVLRQIIYFEYILHSNTIFYALTYLSLEFSSDEVSLLTL